MDHLLARLNLLLAHPRIVRQHNLEFFHQNENLVKTSHKVPCWHCDYHEDADYPPQRPFDLPNFYVDPQRRYLDYDKLSSFVFY